MLLLLRHNDHKNDNEIGDGIFVLIGWITIEKCYSGCTVGKNEDVVEPESGGHDAVLLT